MALHTLHGHRWATILFLEPMSVALVTITYVPVLTEVSAAMSPSDPACGAGVQDTEARSGTRDRSPSAPADESLTCGTGQAQTTTHQSL